MGCGASTEAPAAVDGSTERQRVLLETVEPKKSSFKGISVREEEPESPRVPETPTTGAAAPPPAAPPPAARVPSGARSVSFASDVGGTNTAASPPAEAAVPPSLGVMYSTRSLSGEEMADGPRGYVGYDEEAPAPSTTVTEPSATPAPTTAIEASPEVAAEAAKIAHQYSTRSLTESEMMDGPRGYDGYESTEPAADGMAVLCATIPSMVSHQVPKFVPA